MASMKQSSILQGVAQKGSVLQVVSTTKTDIFTANVAATSFAAVTGLTATITPSSTSSKILVVTVVNSSQDVHHGTAVTRLTRNGTPVGIGDAAGNRTRATSAQSGGIVGNDAGIAGASSNFLDSPATTSALDYGVEVFNHGFSTEAVNVNKAEDDSDASSRLRTVSTITLMEVAG